MIRGMSGEPGKIVFERVYIFWVNILLSLGRSGTYSLWRKWNVFSLEEEALKGRSL